MNMSGIFMILGAAILCMLFVAGLILAIVKRSISIALKTVISSVGIIAIFFGLAGFAQWANDPRISRHVESAEVVGVWKRLPQGFENARLKCTAEFSADGQCAFHSPRLAGDEFGNSTGTWSIQADDRHSILQVELAQAGVRKQASLNFGEENGILFLWYETGDPDAPQRFKYLRQAN